MGPEEQKKNESAKQQYDPCLEPKHEEPQKSHLRYYLIAFTVILLLVLFLAGFFPRYIQRKELNQAAAAENAIIVKTMQVKPDKKKLEIVLPSSLQANFITPIWARSDGYLLMWYFDIGDTVKQGQLLAEIDTPEVDKQYDQTKADLASAKARLEIARISAERWEDLYKHNPEAISVQEVDERRTTYESAKADVNSFDANMKRLEKLQGFKHIYAPFDGTIIERDIDIGSLITAGSNGNPQQLFRIAQTDILRVFVNVPQYAYRLIYYGQPVDVIVREFPNKVFKGVVVRTSKSLDPIARTLLTQVDIDNKNGELYPGLYAEVKFELVPDIVNFIVPTEAVIIRAGLPQVAVLDDKNVVHLKTVKIGLDMGSKMEIIDGLQENDTIVVNPTEKIKDGVHVEILDPKNGGKDEK